jgi:hypothetical protein
MRKDFAIVAATALLMFNLTAVASDTLQEAAERPDFVGIGDILGHQVPIYALGEVYSDAQTVDQFAIEVGTELHAYTSQTTFESCAQICRAPDTGRWGAKLITVEAHAFCPATTLCPEGMEKVGRDIHSHVHVTRYRPTEIDKIILKGNYDMNEFVFTRSDWFSEGDFAIPGGYVIGKHALLFQDGPRKVRYVWKTKQGVEFSPGFAVTRTPTLQKALAMQITSGTPTTPATP